MPRPQSASLSHENRSKAGSPLQWVGLAEQLLPGQSVSSSQALVALIPAAHTVGRPMPSPSAQPTPSCGRGRSSRYRVWW